MNEPRTEGSKWYGARIVAVCVAGLLVSFGLCGVGTTLHLGKGIGLLRMLGLALFALSLVGIVVGVIVLVIEAIVAAQK